MYAAVIDRLTAAGFEHYEVSNFARPGRRSRHNQAYWSGDGYFAAGPGAARYVDGVRETNHRSTTTYLHRVLAGESPVAEREQLDPEARARELLVFALRRIEGVSRTRVRRTNRLHHRRIDRRAAAEIRRRWGCLRIDGDRVAAHPRRPIRQRCDLAGDAVELPSVQISTAAPSAIAGDRAAPPASAAVRRFPPPTVPAPPSVA